MNEPSDKRIFLLLLVFSSVTYLGGSSDSITLNFSRPASGCYVQFYKLVSDLIFLVPIWLNTISLYDTCLTVFYSAHIISCAASSGQGGLSAQGR